MYILEYFTVSDGALVSQFEMGHYHLIGVNITVIKGKQILEPENRPLNIG